MNVKGVNGREDSEKLDSRTIVVCRKVKDKDSFHLEVVCIEQVKREHQLKSQRIFHHIFY